MHDVVCVLDSLSARRRHMGSMAAVVSGDGGGSAFVQDSSKEEGGTDRQTAGRCRAAGEIARHYNHPPEVSSLSHTLIS